MNINLQRWIDRWAGIPLCAAVSGIDAIARKFRKDSDADKAPRAIVVILLSEMGSLVLAHEMFAQLKQRYPMRRCTPCCSARTARSWTSCRWLTRPTYTRWTTNRWRPAVQPVEGDWRTAPGQCRRGD